jgi:Protein of unknown function with HXXEE motif
MYHCIARPFVSQTTFRVAVWLFPAAFVLHVAEEWPRFINWAQRHASSRYTQHDYIIIHLAGIASAIMMAAIVSRFPNRTLVFLFFAFAFAPGLLCNTFFHAGATLVTREYCPGVITAMTIYIPVFSFVCRLAWRENLVSVTTLPSALLIAAAFHTWEVGHNVFKAW